MTLDAAILERLRSGPPQMAGDLAFELEATRDEVLGALERLRKAGLVKRREIHWSAVRKP